MSDDRNIFWLGSWANTRDRLDQLNNNISVIKRSGFKVAVVTHYPDISGINSSECEFVIFDADNSMHYSEEKSFANGFIRINPSCSENRQEAFGNVYIDRTFGAPHQYACLRNHAISLAISSGYGYGCHVYSDSDFNCTDETCQKILTECNKLRDLDLNFIGFESFTLHGSMNTSIFFCKPKFLSDIITMGSVANEEMFYRNYPNETTEDSFMKLLQREPNMILYKAEMIEDLLGKYGIDWDTGHVGLDEWLDNIDEKTISSFTVNAPLLRLERDVFSFAYLAKAEFINDHVYFSAEIDLIDEGGNETSIFSLENHELRPFTFTAWDNFYSTKEMPGSKLRVSTSTRCLDKVLRNTYYIPLDRMELLSYMRIRSW